MKQFSHEALNKIQDILEEGGFMVTRIVENNSIDMGDIKRTLILDLFIKGETYMRVR